MYTPKTLKPGDPCPNCGGELAPVPAPSAEQRKAAADRDNPNPIPPGFDTATETQVQELGALRRCRSCRYQARFKAEAAPDQSYRRGRID